MSGKINVFLDELPWDLRSRNTDWRYVRYTLPRLADFEPSLNLVMQQSHAVTLRGNLKTVRAALGRRIGFPLREYQLDTSHLDESALRKSSADIVFAHRAFPLNAGDTPDRVAKRRHRPKDAAKLRRERCGDRRADRRQRYLVRALHSRAGKYRSGSSSARADVSGACRALFSPCPSSRRT